MSAATSDDERGTFLPDRFPTWPGLIAAVAVAAAWGGLESLHVLPRAVSDWSGGMMIAGHARGGVGSVHPLGRTVPGGQVAGGVGRNPVKNPACTTTTGRSSRSTTRQRLYVRHSTDEIRAEIKKSADLILDRQEWSWRLGQIVCYLIPAVGFAAALMNLRLEGNTVPCARSASPCSSD